MNKNTFRDSTKFSYKPWAIMGGIIAVILTGILALQPLKRSLSLEFLTLGDSHMASQSYVEALVDYQKSDWLNPSDHTRAKIDLANKAQIDVAAAEAFFRSINSLSTLEEFNQARIVPRSESDGLSKVKKLLEDNKPQFAEIAAHNLIEMDDDSSKAWIYLGIARFQSARLTQMTESNRNTKINSAIEAFTKAQELDASDQLAAKYLEEARKLL